MSSEKKRVLLISNRVMHYRISVYNYFFRNFDEAGWEWRVLTNEVQESNRTEAEFELDVMPFKFGNYRRKIEELAPDAVVIFLHMKDKVIWPLVHWLKVKRIPFVIWTKTRNLDDPDNRAKNFLFDYLHRLSDGVILYEEKLRKNLPRSCRSKAFAANNTINSESFPEIEESPAEIRQSLGIPFRKVVLFAGRMDVDKGRKRVDYLIEIFRDGVPRDCGLVIVGSGMKPEWEERINPETTIYLGEVQDPENREISRIFTMADVCAIPGHVGLGINQAFLYGLPVVTMDGGQPPEIEYLHDGENGFLLAGGDVKGLKDRIFDLLENDALREDMGKAARETFDHEASIERMFKGFKDAVSHVCRGKESKGSIPSRQQSEN